MRKLIKIEINIKFKITLNGAIYMVNRHTGYIKQLVWGCLICNISERTAS